MTEPTLDDTRRRTISYATDEKWNDFQLEWYFYFYLISFENIAWFVGL